MNIIKKSSWLLLSLIAFNAHSQALRVTGYEGELVFVDEDRSPVNVAGATRAECEDNFDAVIAANDPSDFYYGRSGTQSCLPVFIYRSPTAPATSLSPAETLWPKLPFSGECISCLIFEHPLVIKELYKEHTDQVYGYVEQFKIDQYNADLKALQNQYRDQLQGFEQKMFDLEQSMSDK